MIFLLKFSFLAGSGLLVLGCNGDALQEETEDAKTSAKSQIALNNGSSSDHRDKNRERDEHVSISRVGKADDAFDFNDAYYKTMTQVENMIDLLQYRESRRADTISVQYCSLSVVRNETNIAIIEDDIIENYSVDTQKLLDCAGFLSCNSRTVKSCLSKLNSRPGAATHPGANSRRDDS